jgi:hypothetical protein
MEVNDLRKKSIEDLTEQELASRIHLVNDEVVRLYHERQSLIKMRGALQKQLTQIGGELRMKKLNQANYDEAFKLGQYAKSIGKLARDNQYGVTTLEAQAWLNGFRCF